MPFIGLEFHFSGKFKLPACDYVHESRNSKEALPKINNLGTFMHLMSRTVELGDCHGEMP
jgi:hypothetical protein